MKLGIVRDDRYLLHKPGYTHPEHPRRLKAVYNALDRYDGEGLVPIVPEPASIETIELVHTPLYIDKVLKTSEHGFTSLAIDTPASSMTYLASWLAVGGCIKALDGLLANDFDTAFALIRPPGHHAMRNAAGGFCIFNNVGITASYACKRHGMRRILVVDWDVHHGNGINDLFYHDDRVFYFSTHDILLYPYTGNFEDAGRDAGAGYTLNIPIDRTMADEDFIYLYDQLLTPVIYRYQPQLIIVASGFDAHRDDPLGRCRLSERAFSGLTDLLLHRKKEIDGSPPVLFVLEGGYQPTALARSVMEVIKCLLSDELVLEIPEPTTESPHRIVRRAREIHKDFSVWTD